jgi:hypothetical protein
MDEKQAHMVGQALNSVRNIIETDFHRAEPRWVREAAFALLMIYMKDALKILAHNGMRVSFADDVPEGDVTDLIAKMRNAICHIDTPLRRIGTMGTLSFCTAEGAVTLLETPELTLQNPYQDDIAFFYGEHRVLLRRHVHRAYEEALNSIGRKCEAEGWRRPN